MKKIFLSALLFFNYGFSFAQTARECFEKAMTYKSNENYVETAKMLERAVELDATNHDYQVELANAYYAGRAYFKATPLYESLLSEEDKNLTYLSRLAEMYSMSPEKGKSVTYAERAMQLEPADASTNKMLARAFFEVNHFPKAIKLYLKAYESEPNDKDITNQLARCYSEIEDWVNAMKYYEIMMAKDPDNAGLIYQAALTAYYGSKFNQAAALFQLAEDKGYNKSESLYQNMALCHREMMNYKEAVRFYEKALTYSPYDKSTNISLAEMFIEMKAFEKAVAVLKTLLEVNPNDAEVIYDIGMAHYRSGNTSKAESFFNRAFELNPALKSLKYVKSNY